MQPISPLRIIRKAVVRDRVGGWSDTTLWRRVRAGTFPKPIKLSGGKYGAVGWIESEVTAWIEARIAARDEGDEVQPVTGVVTDCEV